jgi:F420H(2)-dependent quinone reductase
LPPAERDAVWAKVVALAPRYADYQAKTSRVIPLFELQRA